MKDIEVTARIGKEGPAHTVNFSECETVDEMIETYGEAIVLGLAQSDLTVRLQSFMRSKVSAKDPLTGDALQAAVDSWKPGVRSSGPGRVERLKDRVAKLSPEEKAALLAELTGTTAPAAAPKPTLVKQQEQAKPAASTQRVRR